MIALLLLGGCNTVISDNTSYADDNEEAATAYNLSFDGSDASYEVNGSTYITLGDEDVKITKAGTCPSGACARRPWPPSASA